MKKNLVPHIMILAFGFSLGYLTYFIIDDVSYKKEISVSKHTTGHSAHEKIDIDTNIQPASIHISSEPDGENGYNLFVQTTDFTWTPEAVNSEPIINTGHAHLYINGEKISRLYGPWVYLDGHHLRPGKNRIRVTLNANNHSEWSYRGKVLEDEQIIYY